jgi:hypothetical protein
MMAMLTHMNGTFLKSLADAQEDLMDFLQQRIQEDVALSRQLMQCHSLAEMHQVYLQYLHDAVWDAVSKIRAARREYDSAPCRDGRGERMMAA